MSNARNVIDYDLVTLFLEQFKLSKVTAGETVAILSTDNEWADYAQALMKAASILGARTFNVNVQRNTEVQAAVQGRHPLSDQPLLLQMLKECDMVIDLVGLLF